MNVLRDRNVMARQVEHGAAENVYQLQIMNASDHHRTIAVQVLPSGLVGLTRPVTAALGPAQATSLTVTVRMPVVEALSRPGEKVGIRFVVTDVDGSDRSTAEETTTFFVPR